MKNNRRGSWQIKNNKDFPYKEFIVNQLPALKSKQYLCITYEEYESVRKYYYPVQEKKIFLEVYFSKNTISYVYDINGCCKKVILFQNYNNLLFFNSKEEYENYSILS